jgi:hypothetical protein
MYSLDALGAFSMGTTAPANLELAQISDLDSDRFQSLWMQLPETVPLSKQLK